MYTILPYYFRHQYIWLCMKTIILTINHTFALLNYFFLRNVLYESMFWVTDFICKRWFHYKIYRKHHEMCASAVIFYWLLVRSWPSIDRNRANSQFRQRGLLMYAQMTARIDLVTGQFHLLSTTISSYRYPLMMRCVSTDDLSPYHAKS